MNSFSETIRTPKSLPTYTGWEAQKERKERESREGSWKNNDKNFPNWMKNINPHTQETHQIPGQITLSSHLHTSSSQCQSAKKILKAAREVINPTWEIHNETNNLFLLRKKLKLESNKMMYFKHRKKKTTNQESCIQTTHRMGQNIHISDKTTQLKSKQSIWIDISPKMCKWLVSKASEEMLNTMISHYTKANQTTMIPFYTH